MRLKIGIFGSAEDFDISLIDKAKNVGKLLGKNNTIVITGATSGIPYVSSLEAYKNGAEVWGYSSEQNIKDIKEKMPNHDLSIYKKLIFIPRSFPFAGNVQISKKYRNVISTATCDGAIIISGRIGTLNEFTNLYDMGKVIGILTGTGGISDELEKLMQKIHKKTKSKLFFDSNPKTLINKLITEL